MTREPRRSLWLRLALPALASSFALMPGVASSQQAQAPGFSAGLGARTWFTTGYTTWSFQGSGIDPLSELRLRGTDSLIGEANADLVWKRFVLMTSVGGGAITDGVLIDDDFDRSGHQARSSHTRSSVDDDGVFYFNIDAGWRLVNWGLPGSTLPGYLDVFVGYQRWEETYEAFGITGTPPTASTGTKVITQEYTWDSLRVGGRIHIPMSERLAVHTRAVVLPYTRTRLDDVHHLRTDLQQNPSFSSEADGGLGVQLDFGLLYTVWRGLAVEGGYQFWRIDSGSGDKFTHGVGGTTKDTLNEIVVERGGPYIGLRYRF